MADKILSNNANDKSLSFVQPTYSGFQNSREEYATNSFLSNNLVRAGLVGFGIDTLRRVHKDQLRNNPKYLGYLNKAVNAFEELTPNKIGRTFGLSERIASYDSRPVNYTRQQLVTDRGSLTQLGLGLQRQFGDRFDVLNQSQEGLRFVQTDPASQYKRLVQAEGIEVKFAPAKSQLAGAAYRLDKPLQPKPIKWVRNGSLADKAVGNFRALRASQSPTIHPAAFANTVESVEFLPYHTWFDSNTVTSRFSQAKNALKNLPSRLELETFGPIGLERGQKLLSEVGFGLTQGSYNKAFTIPFFAKEGQKGLVNELLLKRVLPVAIGLTALKYADYLTGHTVSNSLVDIPLKANVVRAELTDRLPGARSITDFYEDVVPGPQYGPLALPAAGAFIGGLIHYGKVLGGKYENDAARHAASKLLPNLKELKNVKNLEGLKVGLKSIWTKLGLPGKGAAIGLAAALPFIPGMIGSRKNAAELRDIYSGEENVPIRSGRFWSLGSSPFSGGRITSWRPHWSLLFKSRANEKSLWGSEKNYWAHNPFIHPIKSLKDPYALENLNYDSRPYPITSPAFSNVPLVGPLLAATIGKFIKPPKRMHEDEFDEREYNMYSTRLNPKGPIVESKFERDVLKDLARKGYQADTQVKVGDYRIDFVLQGENGKKLAIETDGDSYHGKWNQGKDAERQKKLESEGYDFLHIHSTPYFDNLNKAMSTVFAELNKRGIKPIGNNDRDIRSGLIGLAPPVPKDEFNIFHAFKEEVDIFADFIGLTGYTAKTVFDKIFPNKDKDKEVYLQGSRQMDSLSRSYYDTNIGEGLGPNLGSEGGTFGYTEPLRRFIQRDRVGVQANDIPNTMPSWLPGEDYLTNFKVGDPFTKLEQGFARLPGVGYEALHPELEGINPEEYPDLTKLQILADVAPYSREFNIFKDRVGNSIGDDEETRIRYEKILNQAQQTRDSILQVDKKHFTGETESVAGTVKAATSKGVELSEYPGRFFKFSSLGMSSADLSAVVLGQNNSLTRSEVAKEVTNRHQAAHEYISSVLKPGASVNVTVSKGAIDNSEHITAVFNVDGDNVNRQLIDRGYAQLNKKNGGAEGGELFGTVGKIIGSFAERASFDLANFIPAPYHTKLWQERTAYDQYVSQEVVGTRMRRWDRPFDDFASPYARGLLNKATGIKVMSEATIIRRDLNTLVDQLKYIRGLHNIAEGEGDKYTRDTRRTNIGANLLASPLYVASTIPDRDKRYFQQFLSETNPDKRLKILEVVSPEMAKTLQAQWVAADARIAEASDKDPGLVQEQGRIVTQANLEDYSKAKTQLGYGDYLRSKEVAEFFSRTGFSLPEEGVSELFSNNIDYEDVKLKIIQNEGYDAHDFNIFDDRAAMLWRKPYIDGAVSALTSGDSSRSAEQIRRSIEQLMINANNKNPKASIVTQTSRVDKNNVKINISIDEQEKLMKDIRRNPDEYQE